MRRPLRGGRLPWIQREHPWCSAVLHPKNNRAGMGTAAFPAPAGGGGELRGAVGLQPLLWHSRHVSCSFFAGGGGLRSAACCRVRASPPVCSTELKRSPQHSDLCVLRNPPSPCAAAGAAGGSESSSGGIAPSHSEGPFSQKHPELILVVSFVVRDGEAVALPPQHSAAAQALISMGLKCCSQLCHLPPGIFAVPCPIPTDPVVLHRFHSHGASDVGQCLTTRSSCGPVALTMSALRFTSQTKVQLCWSGLTRLRDTFHYLSPKHIQWGRRSQQVYC